MELKLYDTLTREKRVFAPLDPNNVRMYVCGPTVYDYAHIGNARPVIVFDVLFRLLRHLYGADHVTYVRNITDVDDKINARAAERGISIRQLTEETYANFKSDVAALGCLPPTIEPRATEHIEQMKALIERLVADKHAYVADGHVLFDVPSMPDYGRLSKRPMDEMIAGARVEVAPYKKDPQDFVLWKPSKPGEPAWSSPCGIDTQGRPGWHIECSAMSWKHLGETFDIHGGGIDLVFPHHENEIAQSRCAFHTPVMANYWMHNGFLQVEGEKMSKSLGNFVTIHELLSDWPGDVVRLNMLRTHYRQPIDWTFESLLAARDNLREWSEVIFRTFGDVELEEVDGNIRDYVTDPLLDDLNTSLALTRLHELYNSALTDESDLGDFVATLCFFGFNNLNRPGYFHSNFVANISVDGPKIGEGEKKNIQRFVSGTANSMPQIATSAYKELEAAGFELKLNDAGFVYVVNMGNWVEAEDPELASKRRIQILIDQRNVARKQRNFAEADRIRDELLGMGVVLKDSKDGTTWEIAR